MNAAAQLPTGARLAGRYVLDDVIGRGGMAVVYRARDEVLARQVAVKVMAGAAATPDAMQRQFSEAQIGAKLNHSGLVTIFDVHPNDTPPFLVMELVDGITLTTALQRGPIKPPAVAEIGAQLCSALAAVHAAGIVHRDVKPSNVMLASDAARTVKLTDFGISLLVDATRITASGMMVGTARYLAPEQVLAKDVGPAADIYALGLVLIECLAGEAAFPGTQTETLSARLHRSPDLPANLSADWVRVLTAMTAREAVDRPDATATAQALRALAEGRTPRSVVTAHVAAPVAAAVPAPPPAKPTAHLAPPATPSVSEPKRPAAPPAAPLPPPRRAARRGGGKAILMLAVLVIAAVIVGGVLWARPFDSLPSLPGGDSQQTDQTPSDDGGRLPGRDQPAPTDDDELQPSEATGSTDDEAPQNDGPASEGPSDGGTLDDLEVN